MAVIKGWVDSLTIVNYKENLLRSSEVKCVNNGIVAIYKGKEYSCSMMRGGAIIKLMSESPKEGFSKGISFYVKQVDRNECERVYKKELCFKYKKDSFLVRQKVNGRVLLETGPRSYDLMDMGFDRVLQDTFQKWVGETDGELYWNETDY